MAGAQVPLYVGNGWETYVLVLLVWDERNDEQWAVPATFAVQALWPQAQKMGRETHFLPSLVK